MSARPSATSPGHTRRRIRASALCAVAVVGAGCGYRVTPPSAVREPVSVFVLKYDPHASLVLPAEDGGAVEFAYGQWDWFALDQGHWYRALPVLLIPGRAGLGTRSIGLPATRPALELLQGRGNTLEIAVERSRVEALRADLSRRFQPPARTTRNPRLGLEFVPDPQPYSVLYHCNSRVADWLRALGCHVTGLGPTADFRLSDAPRSH